MCSRGLLLKLRDAIQLDDIETVREILLEDPGIVKCANRDLPQGMCSPLWEAMIHGHDDVIEFLIELGADVDERFLFAINDFHGLTYLQCLPFFDDDWETNKRVAEILIERGANVNVFHKFKTPLQISIERGDVKCAEFFLKNGARLSGGLEWNLELPMNFVLRAPKSKQKPMLQLLIKHKLDTDARDKDGHSGFHLALKASADSDVDVVGIAKILSKSGTPVNLFAAARYNNTEILDYLLSNGAEINAANRFGQTALHLSCYYHQEKTTYFLIQKGAHINVKDVVGNTPFLYTLKATLDNKPDFSCTNLMLEVIAESQFFGSRSVAPKDMTLIRGHPSFLRYYQRCVKELILMGVKSIFKPYYLDFSFTKFLVSLGIDPFD